MSPSDAGSTAARTHQSSTAAASSHSSVAASRSGTDTAPPEGAEGSSASGTTRSRPGGTDPDACLTEGLSDQETQQKQDEAEARSWVSVEATAAVAAGLVGARVVEGYIKK
ncbi:hypothetical protein I317_04089 [Kwoniella heveanensis CBS 569]|nr:hypothetical protein I317_04089 [Kwoniella heveanensis CBS 569]